VRSDECQITLCKFCLIDYDFVNALQSSASENVQKPLRISFDFGSKSRDQIKSKPLDFKQRSSSCCCFAIPGCCFVIMATMLWNVSDED